MRHPRPSALTLLLALVVLGLLGERDAKAQVAQFIDSNGPANSNWSNMFNWAPQVVPDGNAAVVQIVNGDPVVDNNYTVNQLVTNFSTPSSSVSGPGTLTIDTNKTFTAAAILNRAGAPAGGTTLSFDGNVTIANSAGNARAVARNENFNGNSIRFDSGSVLTLQSGFETQGGVGGTLAFDGQLAGPENIFFGLNSSNNFGATADNSVFEGDLVFFRDATTVSDIVGGTLVRDGSKVQVNGNNSSIEVNGAETFFGSIVVDGSNNFTFDFDADQSSMDTIGIANGVLTIDVDAAVTELAFDNTSEEEWGTGSISIVGFKENTIRFGTDSSGLTPTQLAAIDGGIYSLNSQGYLSAMSDPALPGDFNNDGTVDNGDLNLLLGSWGSSTVPPEWVNGFEAPVDNGELNDLLSNWGSQAGTSVPEPGTLAIALCGLALACRVIR